VPLQPPDEPRFLLDSSLSRYVAIALRQVGYDVQAIDEAFGRHDGVLDPEVITWVQQNQATWIHADNRSKTMHRIQIITSEIRVLWVIRPGGIMSAPLQLAVLSHALFELRARYQGPNCPLHFQVHTSGLHNPSRIRLLPLDMVPILATPQAISKS
jgi:hypothetical protein